MKYTYFWSKKYIQYSTLIDWFIAITFCRGGSRAAATFKMERFAIIVNSFQPFTIITNLSILDLAAVLDPPLVLTRIQWYEKERAIPFPLLTGKKNG